MLLICMGLETGVVYYIKGEVARGKMGQFKLVASPSEDGSLASAITGLGFRVDGQVRQLFVVTKQSISLFNMHQQIPQRIVLDQSGCDGGCVTMNDNQVQLHAHLCVLVFFFSTRRLI